MFSRTALRKVGSSHARLIPPVPAVRQLSFASTRPSAVALGKRPMSPAFAAVPFGAASSRQFSWTPWRTETPVASVEQPVASTSTATTHEPILSNSHPDLTASSSQPVASTETLASSADLLPQPPADALTPTLEDLILNSGKSLQEVLSSEEAVHAAMKLSDLKLMGYDHGMFSISGWFTDAIVGIHTEFGVPWWGTIALITVAIRLCLSPLLVSTQKHNARLAAINPQITGLMEKVTEAKAKNDIHAQAIIGQAMRGLMTEHRVNPLRALLLPAVQLPIFLTFFNIVRGLANLPVPQMKEGGIGWVTDLTVADPYYILPLTSLLFTNLVFKFGADGMNTEMKSGSPTRTAHIRNFIQITTFMSFPVVAYFPAAILFYWTFSTGFTLLQSLILRQPTVKAMLGIPSPPRVPAPPGQAPHKDPSYWDSFKAIQEWWKDSMERAQTQHAARLEEMDAAKRLEGGASSGRVSRALAQQESAGFVEKIKESTPPPPPPSSSSSSIQSSQRLTAAPSATTRRVDARQAEKQRRIEQARQKRARQ